MEQIIFIIILLAILSYINYKFRNMKIYRYIQDIVMIVFMFMIIHISMAPHRIARFEYYISHFLQ